LKDDDAALLRRYRNGEAAAFTQLYERHRLGLFRFLLGLCGDHALAEEVFQDTWMSLIRSASEQREAVLFKTWLYQIARNRLIDHWRKSGRHQGKLAEYDEAQHASADPGPGPERSCCSAATRSACRRHWPTCPRSSARCSCCAPMATWSWRRSPN